MTHIPRKINFSVINNTFVIGHWFIAMFLPALLTKDNGESPSQLPTPDSLLPTPSQG
ncbi:MAG: hypothetical protein F6K53_35585 [Moorea sp. SIO4A1]|uniref:hypothetical protein n=1 Tax=Moorena sp. SIO4A1 TaxID=2607835 RepID=UPI001450F501|nr:hypothetical protein [Moorena sp. SIO4A1]NEQ62431.1 hypothetical protein [Moorena sp. SIO4A1]